jgi:integrase/recombinase XerC
VLFCRRRYAYAVLRQTIKPNPAAEVMPAISEKTASLALPRHLWVLLRESLPSGYQFEAKRNRLKLLLMMRCALTISETITLTVSSALRSSPLTCPTARRTPLPP